MLGRKSSTKPQMITIVLIGAVTALAMFAILLKLGSGGPKKADKLEKGEVLKQLLALSELEERGAKSKTPMPPRASRVDNATPPRPSSPAKAIGRTSCAT